MGTLVRGVWLGLLGSVILLGEVVVSVRQVRFNAILRFVAGLVRQVQSESYWFCTRINARLVNNISHDGSIVVYSQSPDTLEVTSPSRKSQVP